MSTGKRNKPMPKRRMRLEEYSDRKCRRRVYRLWYYAASGKPATEGWECCGKPSYYVCETWIDGDYFGKHGNRAHWRSHPRCKEHGLEWAEKHDVEVP